MVLLERSPAGDMRPAPGYRQLALALYAAVVAACGTSTTPPTTEAQTEAKGDSSEVVYADVSVPGLLVKSIPIKPDPADDAVDRDSCLRAGGEWDDYYLQIPLLTREPQGNEKSSGKMCWSNRDINKLADAGKPCSGQSDCIGNCVSEMQGKNAWSAPHCQSYADEPPCDFIFEGGKYHRVYCPVP